MLPFVRGAEDIRNLRQALAEAGAPQLKILAKIENLAGVQALPEFLPLVDEVVIARGDLGNAMPLWELPRCQKQLSAACRAAGVPFMVVTQMLDSMHTRAVPARRCDRRRRRCFCRIHPRASCRVVWKYSLGVMPYSFLKARKKWL